MTVEFTSETGQHKRVENPFQAGGCDSQPFDADVKVTPTRIEPDTEPAVDIETAFPFGGATAQAIDVKIPPGFGVNRKSSVKPCSLAQADSRSCGPESQIATVSAETPLIGSLSGQVYLTEASGDAIKGLQVLIEPPPGLENLAIDLRGKLVKSATGPGFVVELRDMPEVPISRLLIQMQGGPERGLLLAPHNCGSYSFQAVAQSHSGKQLQKEVPITVDGEGCAPKLIAAATPASAGAKSKLQFSVVPNSGKSKLSSLAIDWGSKQLKGLAVQTTKARGHSKQNLAAGSLQISLQTGQTLRSDLAASGSKKAGALTLQARNCRMKMRPRARRSSKRRGAACRQNKRLAGAENITVKVGRRSLKVDGLPKSLAVKQLRIELDGRDRKVLEIRNPRRPGEYPVNGHFSHADGAVTSSKADLSITRRQRKRSKGGGVSIQGRR